MTAIISDSVAESVAFHQWLKRHDSHLRAYTPAEIALLAMACGFELSTIRSGVVDRLSLIERLMEFWESPLADKWMNLTEYQNGNEGAYDHEK